MATDDRPPSAFVLFVTLVFPLMSMMGRRPSPVFASIHEQETDGPACQPPPASSIWAKEQ